MRAAGYSIRGSSCLSSSHEKNKIRPLPHTPKSVSWKQKKPQLWLNGCGVGSEERFQGSFTGRHVEYNQLHWTIAAHPQTFTRENRMPEISLRFSFRVKECDCLGCKSCWGAKTWEAKWACRGTTSAAEEDNQQRKVPKHIYSRAIITVWGADTNNVGLWLSKSHWIPVTFLFNSLKYFMVLTSIAVWGIHDDM